MIEAILLPFVTILAIAAVYFLLKSPGKRAVSEFGAALQMRLRLVGTFILVTGLFAAAVAYRRADSTSVGDDGALGYAIGAGYAVPIPPVETKRDDYQMETLGGRANVVAAEFRAWFGSLWHGRRLAPTLAALSVGGCLICLLSARLLACPPPPDSRDGRI